VLRLERLDGSAVKHSRRHGWRGLFHALGLRASLETGL